jgi:5'-3' exonuclease
MDILIDGKNVVYRSLFAALDKITGKVKVDPIIIALRQFVKWRRIYKPDNWCIFWDVPKNNLWRKKLYPPYKEGRDKSFIDKSTLSELVSRFNTIFINILHNMKMTQFIKSENEADDLIYAYIKAYNDKELLIVSSDGDMVQVLLKCNNVKLHDPKNKDILYVPKPEYDPVTVKCLSGDTSDNIDGYRLVGDITAKKIMRENRVDAFLSEKGREMFDLNKKLVDFDMNDDLNSNIEYIKSVKKNDKFDIKAINNIIDKYSLTELKQLMSDLIIPFKYNP